MLPIVGPKRLVVVVWCGREGGEGEGEGEGVEIVCSCTGSFFVVFLDLCVAMWVSDQTRSREVGNGGAGFFPSFHTSLTSAQRLSHPSSIMKGYAFAFVC